MKKSTITAIIVIVLAIIAIVIFGRSSSNNQNSGQANQQNNQQNNGNPAPVVPSVETTKVSGKTSQYKNSELGFSVTYPNTWEADETDSGVTFIMPIDQTQVSTVAKLQVDVNVVQSKCAFPPVTTVKDRSSITVGSNTFNTITMSNSVQGRAYWDRIYTLAQGKTCYFFHLSTITFAPESKGMTGSNLTQAQNNNKAIIATSDADFTTMVKSFDFVQGPAGVDETQAPKK